MKNRVRFLAFVLILSMLFGGCATTVEQMYRLPRRSERFEDLQSQIEIAMTGMEYSAPAAGENQQTVQMADLTGDGVSEVIVFARGTDADPMKLLIFTPAQEGYRLMSVLESAGTAFDQVEYVQMDTQPGLELAVGRQVSDKVMRNLTVYTFAGEQTRQIMNTNYTKFLACDMDEDGLSDLVVIHPGQQEGENAYAALYRILDGVPYRSAEAGLSATVDSLKRIITGRLESGEKAVFVASTAGEESLVTDVFALVDGSFTNVSLSADTGTSVATLRNYYVYADDIDSDGVVELPYLVTMISTGAQRMTQREHLIRWYAMTSGGTEVIKMYTYHNYLDGWYVELNRDMALRMFVTNDEQGGYQFYLRSGETAELLFTLYSLTGEERLTAAKEGDLIEILKTDTAVYCARLTEDAGDHGITQESLSGAFRLIQMDWKSGEM